jgi:hypothetical protein
VLVDANSLTRDEAGRIHAQAVTSYENEARAHEHLGKSTGLALYAVPQRLLLSKGDTLELWGDATLHVKGPQPARSVEQQLAQAEFSAERRSENYVLARWNDASGEPTPGQRVRWEGPAFAYNAVPVDFKAGPVAARDRGQVSEPLWVVIERDEGKGSIGRVVNFSTERDAMTADLAQREQSHQAITRDWQQQSLGVDRSRFTHGQSM